MSAVSAVTLLKEVFRFPFQGKWRDRFLVGTALTFAGFLVPIVPLIFVYGYTLQIMRQAIEGAELTLPVWDDWNKLGKDSLIPFVIAPIGFYLSLVSAALFGQAYRESVSTADAPTAN